MRNLFVINLILGLTLTTMPALAQSQANTGAIEGVVTDEHSKSIAGASISLVNIGTNFTRDLSSDTEGRFRGLLLPLGAYKVTVKAAGFGTLVRNGVNLAVGQSVNLGLTLTGDCPTFR